MYNHLLSDLLVQQNPIQNVSKQNIFKISKGGKTVHFIIRVYLILILLLYNGNSDFIIADDYENVIIDLF